MKRVRLLVVLGSVVLALVIALVPFIGACAPAPPEPTPPAPEHEPYTIKILSLPVGFIGYVLSVGLADLINKNSSWLKAEALESPSPVFNHKTLAWDPTARKNTIINTSEKNIWYAKKGLGGFVGFQPDYDWDNIRYISMNTLVLNGIFTVDPNIKTLEDLSGKIFVPDSGRGNPKDEVFRYCLEQAGVLDTVRLEYMESAAAAEALRDGVIDAMCLGAVLSSPPPSTSVIPSSYVEECMAIEDVYFVSMGEEYLSRYVEETGFPAVPMTIPAGAFGPAQTEPFVCWYNASGWGCDISMPDDVVTEILRVLWENIDRLGEFHRAGAAITHDTMAIMGVPEQRFHPAAVKFYHSKGIKIE